jgi:RES domain-containing protein
MSLLVYRITLTKWAGVLRASGQQARWNSKGNNIIYTAGTQALACLENLVHRSGEGLNADFSVTTIHIPDIVSTITLERDELPQNWNTLLGFEKTQLIGDSWILKNTSAVLKVPSVIIPDEHNYLINPSHSDFKSIKVNSVTSFIFDQRLKS